MRLSSDDDDDDDEEEEEKELRCIRQDVKERIFVLRALRDKWMMIRQLGGRGDKQCLDQPPSISFILFLFGFHNVRFRRR